MALLCCFGVCIPYSVIWPFVLLFLKQIWEYFVPKKSNTKKSDISTSSEIKTLETVVDSEHAQMSISLDKNMDWESIINCKRKTIVRFTASWCKPCKELEPLFNTLSKKFCREANFISVDVDEFDELSAKYSALSIPLFLCIYEGQEIKRISGKNEENLRQFIEECLNDSVKTESE